MDSRIYENYVMHIFEQGGFTKAASKLGISQPALSAGLSNLEKEIGITIFNRKTVPISFTPEGQVYYEYIKKKNILNADFNNRIQSIRDCESQHVSIGAPAVYAQSIVSNAVMKLMNRFPNYKIQIQAGSVPELINMALDCRINCFISTDENLPYSFVQKKIRDELVYLVVPKGNPINQKLADFRVKPGDTGNLFDYSILSKQQFIFLEDSQPLQKKANTFFKDYSISPSSAVTVDQVSTAVSLSIMGAGLCFASEGALSGGISLDDVYIYPLPDTVSGRSIFVAYNRDLYPGVACEKLIYYLEGRES